MCRIHGLIHSVLFVGLALDFYSFVFLLGFYLFLFLYILIQTDKLAYVYIIELVVGKLLQMLYSKLCDCFSFFKENDK